MSAAAHSGRGRELRHPVILAVSIVAAPLLWMLFVASFAIHEMLVGIVASAATVVFSLFIARESNTDLILTFRDLAQCWRIPWYILSGVFEITLVLLKDLLHIAPAGSFYRVCGFDTSTHDPLRMSRTILAMGYTTASPNCIVLGVDPAQSRMLFYQIARSKVSKMTKALGART